MKTTTQPGAAVSAHTALPWIVTQPSAGTLDICHEADGIRSRIARLHYELIAPEHDGSIAGNAELICSAVNSHAVLIDTLYAALTYVEMADYDKSYKPGAVAKMVREIRAALAAATH